MCILGNKCRAGNPPFMLLSVHFVLLFIRYDLSDCFHAFCGLPQSKSELYFLGSYSQLKTCHSISKYFYSFHIQNFILSLLLFLEVNVVCSVTL